MRRVLHKVIWTYLSIVGVLTYMVLLLGFVVVPKYFQFTPSQFLLKAVEKSGIDSPWVVSVLSPSQRFSSHSLDGQLQPGHPRIILPQLATWSGGDMSPLIARRVALYQVKSMMDFDPCLMGDEIMAQTACWVSSGDSSVALGLISILKNFQLQAPDVQAQYGNGWKLAFAYDLVANSAEISADERVKIEMKIEYALRDYLAVLDDASPSLWHGRTSLASMAWLCAVVLDPAKGRHRASLITRAQGHFLDVVRAVELTEAWPEGYNYWIQNRGLIFVLAASAYVNGLENAQHTLRIHQLLQRVGLWHIYATRPDNRIEGIGDEGSRVDLKDETRRVIDVIAQLTQDPVFATFSRYIGELHGEESYFRSYRWGYRLFNDPEVKTAKNGEKGLAIFNGLLPRAALFGRGGMNLGYIRSSWSSDATFISFHAGQTFTHHGHYDAGHFSIFKGAPLAINSSTYGDYTGPNRLNYSIRTVAKNSLLILRPGEQVKPNHFFKNNVADGGQRVIIPSGSAIQNVNDWAANRNDGMHYAGGLIQNYDVLDGLYAYIATDLTRAYNTPDHDEGGRGGKVREVKRNLVYLFDEDRLLIHDRIVSTHPSYTKKWLLHSINQPKMENVTLLKGVMNNGISESRSSVVNIRNGNSHLRVDRIYPEDAVIRLVGGPDYQFYVESDGDDADLDGKNYSAGASLKPWFDVGMWRMEIQPGVSRLEDEFLVALSPSLDQARVSQVKPLPVFSIRAKAVLTEYSVVIFVSSVAHGRLQFKIPNKKRRVLIFGLPARIQVKLQSQGNTALLSSNEEGVVLASLKGINLSDHSGQLSLEW